MEFRAGSRSLVAQGANLTRLMELTAKVPFDDRINQQAQLNDLDMGIIERTIPDKPNSRLQKYRLTQKGAKLLK